MQKADRCFSAALAAQVALARLTQRGADFCGSYGAAAAHLLRSQVAIYSLIFVSSELSADPLLQYRGTCRSSGALNNYKASSRAALRSAHLVQGGHGVFVLHVARSPTLSYGRVCQTKNMAFCSHLHILPMGAQSALPARTAATQLARNNLSAFGGSSLGVSAAAIRGRKALPLVYEHPSDADEA